MTRDEVEKQLVQMLHKAAPDGTTEMSVARLKYFDTMYWNFYCDETAQAQTRELFAKPEEKTAGAEG